MDPTNSWVDTGWRTINGQTYYLDPSQNGKMLTGAQEINQKWYYFDPIQGYQLKETAVDSQGHLINIVNGQLILNNPNNLKATVQSGIITLNQSGIQSVNGRIFNYDFANKHFISGWVKQNGSWYFFSPADFAAVTGWYRSAKGSWYYMDNSGRAVTGWHYIDNNWYYMDPTNAWAVTGWHKINGAWYYMEPGKAWAYRGDHWINGVEYYFDPTNAWLYQNRWVNIGGWTYHADSNGHLWFPQWYTQFPVLEGCSVASLGMLLSAKEYIPWNYAYNLLQGRQGGDIYSGAGFSRVIQPGSLVELARHFDSSVRDISGSSVQDIINLVNSGHPVEYYGYSRYENRYWSHNHCKVIVGYQNGWFRVYDPCYYYASQGSTGMNAFDYGAKAWITTAQFAREYAGQAITVG